MLKQTCKALLGLALAVVAIASTSSFAQAATAPCVKPIMLNGKIDGCAIYGTTPTEDPWHPATAGPVRNPDMRLAAEKKTSAQPQTTATFAPRAGASMFSNIDDKSVQYVGALPPRFHAIGGKNTVNDLGDLNWFSTEEAVQKYGEAPVRQAVVRGIKACGRIAVQREALFALAQQTADATAAQEKNKSGRKGAQVGAAGSTIVGGVGGFKFGPVYGWMNVFGSTIPSLLQQGVYAKTLDQNDIMIALTLAQSRYYVSVNDFYLDLVGNDYCPVLIEWVNRFGDVQPVGGSTSNYVPLAPSSYGR